MNGYQKLSNPFYYTEESTNQKTPKSRKKRTDEQSAKSIADMIMQHARNLIKEIRQDL